MKLSREGLQLILDHEVGGGQAYYEAHCLHPSIPDLVNTVSGVTIGIGCDLGYCSRHEFHEQWDGFIDPEVIALLSKFCGHKDINDRHALDGEVGEIIIPWEAALAHFEQFTVPKTFNQMIEAFPGIDQAPQAVQEAILSLVFNRGPSMKGSRRLEMRDIRLLVSMRRWDGIPYLLRCMKRLWPNTKGLRLRREAEARHIERYFGPIVNRTPTS